MKKKLSLILICLICVVISVFTLVGCTGTKGYQNVVSDFVGGTTPFETLEEFVTKFPDRTAIQSYNNDKSKDAALWISEQLASFGYESNYEDGLDVFTYQNGVTKRNELGYNVVYRKSSNATNNSNKVVVVGAHYDNVFDIAFNGTKLYSDGTYNNGVGVATLIELARVLQNVDLPFNVEFVAFSAEEFGWFGSERYLAQCSFKNDIMLMINFDRNAIGDNVYMYSSEAKTKHNKYFYDIVKENNLPITDIPTYLNPAFGSYFEGSIKIHEANYADSQLFLEQGINIINFLSMNFKPGAVVESEGQANISYTSNDRFDMVINRLGGIEQAKQTIDSQINSAISTVVYAFQKEDFVSVISSSKANNGLDNFANSNIMSYISYGLIGGGILIFVILYFVLRSSVKPHDVYVNTIYGRLNTTTGKIEVPNTPPNSNAGGNVGNVFGNEFDSAQNNGNGENRGGANSGNKDKINDIFGDF